MKESNDTFVIASSPRGDTAHHFDWIFNPNCCLEKKKMEAERKGNNSEVSATGDNIIIRPAAKGVN